MSELSGANKNLHNHSKNLHNHSKNDVPFGNLQTCSQSTASFHINVRETDIKFVKAKKSKGFPEFKT